MEIIAPTYLMGLGCMVVLTTGIAIQAFIKWKKPGARTLGFLMLSMAVWAGFYLLEIMHPSAPVKILARKALYIGMSMTPPLWLGFALRYTGIHDWWSKSGRTFILMAPGSLATVLGFTNDYHHLIWHSIRLPGVNPAPLMLEYGAGFWVFTTIAYMLIGIGMAAYLRFFFSGDADMRAKSGVILGGVTMTIVTSAIFLFSKNPTAFDPTPLSFAVSAPLIALGYFRFGVTSLLPRAATLVMDNLRDAILIVDGSNRLTDFNQPAASLLNITPQDRNHPLPNLLPDWKMLEEIWNDPNSQRIVQFFHDEIPQWYEVRIMPLQQKGNTPLGKIIVFHNITTEQSLLHAERRRSQQLALLEESGRIVADSFNEQEILQRAVNTIIERFGYAEAAISKLNRDNKLEVAAIAGTQDFGYRPGFQQEMGTGIIGHTASTGKTYITNDVANDPHYFSNDRHEGSAICTPIWKRGSLFGVLYVESIQKNTFDNLDVTTLETLTRQIASSLHRASLHEETRENLRMISAIQSISKAIASSLDMETISQYVVYQLSIVFGYSHISIYVLEDEYLKLAAQHGYPEEMVIDTIHISQGVSGRAIRTKSVQFIEDIRGESVFLMADHNLTSEICVPLIKDDLVIGMLNVETKGGRRLTASDVNLLTTLAGPIAVAMDNARLHAEVKKLATTDAVTGLANRHVFEQSLSAEIERARRQDTPLSLIIFDIDSFKEYNDAWGHPAGDARLKAVADLIKSKLRKYDIAARYGGDEFAIILSNSGAEEALAFAKRLHLAAMEGSPHSIPETGGEPGYTLSIGIATFPKDATTEVDLLNTADRAAMLAKQNGKNQIRRAGKPAQDETA